MGPRFVDRSLGRFVGGVDAHEARARQRQLVDSKRERTFKDERRAHAVDGSRGTDGLVAPDEQSDVPRVADCARWVQCVWRPGAQQRHNQFTTSR